MIPQIVGAGFVRWEDRDARCEVFVDPRDLQQGRHLCNISVKHQGLLTELLSFEAQGVGVQSVHEGWLFDRMQRNGTVNFLVLEVAGEGTTSAAVVVQNGLHLKKRRF